MLSVEETSRSPFEDHSEVWCLLKQWPSSPERESVEESLGMNVVNPLAVPCKSIMAKRAMGQLPKTTTVAPTGMGICATMHPWVVGSCLIFTRPS